MLIPPTSPFHAEDPRAVADGALAIMAEDSAGVSLLRPDGSFTLLIPTSSPTRVTTLIGVDHEQGDAIVWVETDRGNYAADVIWTSPYTADPSAIQRRAVAVVNDPTGTGMIANAGVVLRVTGPQTAVLTRLSDGMGWSIAAEPSDAFVTPLWVDDNEVWISTGVANAPNYQADEKGIMRLDRTTLGAPTVPPGL